MARFHLFEKRSVRATLLRHQAEEIFYQLSRSHPKVALANTPLHGQHNKRSGGQGHDFWQYNNFQNGDSASTIDWKQSAKSDRLLVRQKERETQSRTSIWLQNDASMNFSGSPHGQTKYECGAVIALAATMLGAARHDPVSLSGVGFVSIDDMTAILDEAKFIPEVEDLTGHEVYLIGDFLQPTNFFDLIGSHKRVHLIQILDPVEIDLPFKGRVVFQQPEGSQQEKVLNVADTRAAYQERLHDHCKDLSAYCASRNWSYSFIRSGQDLFPPFLDLLSHGEDL